MFSSIKVTSIALSSFLLSVKTTVMGESLPSSSLPLSLVVPAIHADLQ